MPATNLILPYVVPIKDRKKKFSTSMELTAVLCLAEARRKKYAIIGFSSEKISFISKLFYPMWAVPWEGRCLILDGLQILSSTLTYMTLPDMEPFFKDIERGQTQRELFLSALEKHTKTFACFAETAQIPTKAIVADKELLSDISQYIEENLAPEGDVKENIILIPSKLDEDAAEKSMKTIFNLYERIQSDIKGLEHAASQLNEMTQFHEQKILHEIELVNETFKEEVDRVAPVVEKKVGLLLKERDTKIDKINRAAKAILNAKLREKERRQRELEKLELKRTEYRRRLDARRHKGDRVSAVRWEHSLRTCENRIYDVKETIYNLSNYIEKTYRQNQEEVNRSKYDYQTLIDRERKKIADIEATWESINKAKESENDRLQMLTKRIVSFIAQLTVQERSAASELKALTIPWQPKQVTLIGVPFYFVGYKTEDKFNYRVYPPLRVMSSKGIVKRIKKTLLSFRLASRIKLLVQPRSKALNKMFNTVLEKRMKTDKTVEESLRGFGLANNLLTNPDLREMLAKGLGELKAEGWIRQEECAILMKTYA